MFMDRMSTIAEISGRNYGDSSQVTNWILDSVVTCHMKPDIQEFILVLLVETDKYIKVADKSFVTVKQTGEVQIKTCGKNGKPFIAVLYILLLAPAL